jgi:diketogulonate reductase-like aldo/keto reductase
MMREFGSTSTTTRFHHLGEHEGIMVVAYHPVALMKMPILSQIIKKSNK